MILVGELNLILISLLISPITWCGGKKWSLFPKSSAKKKQKTESKKQMASAWFGEMIKLMVEPINKYSFRGVNKELLSKVGAWVFRSYESTCIRRSWPPAQGPHMEQLMEKDQQGFWGHGQRGTTPENICWEKEKRRLEWCKNYNGISNFQCRYQFWETLKVYPFFF